MISAVALGKKTKQEGHDVPSGTGADWLPSREAGSTDDEASVEDHLRPPSEVGVTRVRLAHGCHWLVSHPVMGFAGLAYEPLERATHTGLTNIRAI